jgi:hypothetical protein
MGLYGDKEGLIMPDNIWTVGERNGVVTKEIDKHHYVAKIQIPKDVDETTKKFWVNYNSMQKKLMDHDLMDSK